MSAKKLDLFLLAGCSCLLTLLHHPIAEALTASQFPVDRLPSGQSSLQTELSNVLLSSGLAAISEETPKIQP